MQREAAAGIFTISIVDTMAKVVFFMAGAYIAGSVNFSILLFRLLGRGDPRRQFSGNAGATNVYRQAGLGWAALVLLLDMGRAVGVAAAAVWLLPYEWVPWAGLGLIVGNRVPVFHGFKGGKGVANYLGFSAFLAPWAATASVIAWYGVYRIWKTPFISSFAMVFILAAGTALVFNWHFIPLCGVVATAAFIVYSHRGNIAERLR